MRPGSKILIDYEQTDRSTKPRARADCCSHWLQRFREFADAHGSFVYASGLLIAWLGSGSEETLVALSLLVACLYILKGGLDYARGRVMARFGAQFQSALDAEVFNISIEEAIDPKARVKSASGLRDLETLQQLFTSPVFLALCDIPWTPFFIVLIFIFNPLLGWLALAGGAVLIGLTLANHKLSREKILQAQSMSAQASSFAEEARAQAELVMGQGFGPNMLSEWSKRISQALDQTLSANDTSGIFSTSTKTFRLFLQSANAWAWRLSLFFKGK